MDEGMELDQLLPMSIERIKRLIRMTIRQEIVRKVGAPDLRIIDFIALRMISRRPGLTIKELSTHLGTSHSTTSGMVERYERMQLIQKVVNETDHRSYRLYLSPNSEEIMRNEIRGVTDDLFATLLQQLSKKEREGLQIGLSGLLRVVDEQLQHFASDHPTCES
ncbi:MarR family winged helix-turn-helix transcriptional regulator [Sulfoacidibacillus thermotolerans]|uniref:HTH marR-type domain-containing protein n=1 Tax=Sulfoacidibacillus thermotolerans TaxID=1765684 RepID=A0A2U3D7N8_SULT2|nr:MarR family transcriptional regulator [Sulfoacidibacillus thermotolerans]PWI57305.1 hypothetical protein BM613_09420 [Sulfoacidibacillus thermotolerans]